jgi:hypothetical protein
MVSTPSESGNIQAVSITQPAGRLRSTALPAPLNCQEVYISLYICNTQIFTLTPSGLVLLFVYKVPMSVRIDGLAVRALAWDDGGHDCY